MSKIKGRGIMDENQFRNVVIQLTDHLFEQGHTINRPMIIDAAEFVRMYAESWFMQGEAHEKIKAKGLLNEVDSQAHDKPKRKLAHMNNPSQTMNSREFIGTDNE